MSGLDQIAAGYAADAGSGAEIDTSLTVVLGRLAAHLDRAERARAKMWELVHTVPIRGTALTGLSNASGIIDQPERFGPHDGYWWDVARISAWGWTAGSVTVFMNDPNGEQLASFPAPGQWSWGHRQNPLGPKDRMIFVAAGLTGAVYVGGIATQVRADFWPEYVA